MNLTVNIKNVPSEVNRPYIVVRFCNGELWYYGQYDDVERANDVAEGLGMATVFDNSSYNAIEALEQEPRKDEIILTKEEYGELVSSEFDNGYAKGYREALEDEPCVEPLERLAESASKTAKVLERLKVSEQEPIEVEATKLQMAYNQGFEDCRKAVMNLLNEAGKLSLLAMVADLASINPKEPKYCDRNICIKNEYNGIGCDECEVQNESVN